jgi:hypothetical protein
VTDISVSGMAEIAVPRSRSRCLGFAKAGGYIGCARIGKGIGPLAAKADGLLWADRRPASRGEHDMMKLFLLVAGVFLLPVALSYGVDPAATLQKFMNITVEGTDHSLPLWWLP